MKRTYGAVALSSALVFLGFGCAKQTAVPESPVSVTATPTPQADPAVDAYANKLAPILAARIKATDEWMEALRKASPDDPDFGPPELGPPTDRYAKAVEKAEKDLEKLTPPPSARKVHEGFRRLFKRLGANLDATVAAMRSDGDDNVIQLASERKQILAEGELDLKIALTSGGFDVDRFRKTGELKQIR